MQKIYLYWEKITVMTSSRINWVWLMNNVNWLIKVFFTCEIIKNSLKRGKNNTLHAYLGHIMRLIERKLSW